MKVFISHSGARSRALAEELQKFIRKLVPSAVPWISTGIEKGSRWIPEIAENLEAAGVGIVCITSDNLTAPWLLFEAGALSKRLDGRVCTFLLDVDASVVEAPLSQFQHTKAVQADVLALVETINRQVENAKGQPRNDEDLREQFDTLWPKFEQTLSELRQRAASQAPITRTTDDMLKEVLDVVRGLARQSAQTVEPDDDYVAELLNRGSRSQPPPPVARGESVLHPQFGLGTVVKFAHVPDDNDYKVIVDFAAVGRKTLRWKYARLEKQQPRKPD